MSPVSKRNEKVQGRDCAAKNSHTPGAFVVKIDPLQMLCEEGAGGEGLYQEFLPGDFAELGKVLRLEALGPGGLAPSDAGDKSCHELYPNATSEQGEEQSLRNTVELSTPHHHHKGDDANVRARPLSRKVSFIEESAIEESQNKIHFDW
jgi:hypothetical protein